jgi:uncharacterized protein YggU (UPF0235/DUF167 family)
MSDALATDMPYRIAGDRLLVDVRLTPRGGKDAIEGAERLADGRAIFKARVRAAPEDGKANTALEDLLATSLGVARSKVAVIQGKTSRVKTLAVAGDPAILSAAASRLLAVMAFVVALVACSPAALAQFGAGGDICNDQTEFLRTRVTVERSGLPTPDRARLVRTLRAAQSLAREACPQRDGWLIRRAVGMLNAVNREVRRPPVELPLFLRD